MCYDFVCLVWLVWQVAWKASSDRREVLDLRLFLLLLHLVFGGQKSPT